MGEGGGVGDAGEESGKGHCVVLLLLQLLLLLLLLQWPLLLL